MMSICRSAIRCAPSAKFFSYAVSIYVVPAPLYTPAAPVHLLVPGESLSIPFSSHVPIGLTDSTTAWFSSFACRRFRNAKSACSRRSKKRKRCVRLAGP